VLRQGITGFNNICGVLSQRTAHRKIGALSSLCFFALMRVRTSPSLLLLVQGKEPQVAVGRADESVRRSSDSFGESFGPNADIITEYPQFFTATCLEWKALLKPDKYKDHIVESMRFLAEDKRAIIFGFAITINHVHAIWQMRAGIQRSHLQRDFLKYTAQQRI
jgi:hypothetical protein